MLSLALILLTIDIYVATGIGVVTKKFSLRKKKILHWFYWSATGFTMVVLARYGFTSFHAPDKFLRLIFFPFVLLNYLPKIFMLIFLLLDDAVRLMRWTKRKLMSRSQSAPEQVETGIPRADFLVKTAMIAATAPIVALGYGIVSGAHDYLLKKISITLPHLPSTFHGLRIGQLSDIHSGSFFNKTAVKGGVALLMREKPDVIFFTGDLVNVQTDEVNDYINIFNKIKAPLGVYATLGNHDYGDYRTWPSIQAKQKNLVAMCHAHTLLGWHLLMNAHTVIQQNKDKLAVIGVENWGTGRFSKHGKLAQAYQGTEAIPVKLLLSHNPSHWDAEVRPHFSDIDVTFAGHTHGFQFGIELKNFKWSPAQYYYKQWAGLYCKAQQYLYVNRGFGYIGYPGRIGILPELTIIELNKG